MTTTGTIQEKTDSATRDTPIVTPQPALDGFPGRAVFATKRGGPEVLQVGEHRVPRPGTDEVVVAVRAAGVAFGDIMLREGLRRDVRPPIIPGYDAAGIVVAVGASVTDMQPGDSVAVRTSGSTGGYATHLLAPRWAAVPYPAHLDPAAVTSLVLNYLTAFQMLTRAAPIADGATILVHSAAGGVGSALLQLGALRGLRMFGTASAGKAAFVAEHGGIPTISPTSSKASGSPATTRTPSSPPAPIGTATTWPTSWRSGRGALPRPPSTGSSR